MEGRKAFFDSQFNLLIRSPGKTSRCVNGIGGILPVEPVALRIAAYCTRGVQKSGNKAPLRRRPVAQGGTETGAAGHARCGAAGPPRRGVILRSAVLRAARGCVRPDADLRAIRGHGLRRGGMATVRPLRAARFPPRTMRVAAPGPARSSARHARSGSPAPVPGHRRGAPPCFTHRAMSAAHGGARQIRAGPTRRGTAKNHCRWTRRVNTFRREIG